MKYSRKSDCKKLLILLLFLFLAVLPEVSAQQFPSQFWHPGYVVTAKKDTVKGHVKYDMLANSLQLKTDSKVLSFSSHSVIYCEIYDVTIDNTRRFYSIPYELNKGFKSRILFELLFEGPTSLLSREEIVQEVINNGVNTNGVIPVVRDRLKYHFYFLNNKGDIQYYSGRRSDLLDLLGEKSASMKSFIRDNRLKTDEVRDLIRIIAFYNTI